MIRLYDPSPASPTYSVWTSGTYSHPVQTGFSSGVDYPLTHNLGQIADFVQCYDAATNVPYMDKEDTSAHRVGYLLVNTNPSTANSCTVTCYRLSSSARNIYFKVFALDSTHL
jgi:hypothetical protein